MRHTLLAAFVLLLINVVQPVSSLAAGNVLLPSSSNDPGGPPSANLGIAPQIPSVPTVSDTLAPSALPSSTTTAPSPEVQGSPHAVAATSATVSSDSSNQTPAPPSLNAASYVTLSKNNVGNNAPLGKLPTLVLHQPDMSVALAAANAGLPFSLTITVSGKSLFGAQDVQKITSKLGLSQSDVTASCVLSVGGMLKTDKNSYIINGTSSPQIVVHYDGTIKSYFMAAQASCAANTLPSDAGNITESGGRYLVPLQPISCDPPTRQVTQLIVTYNGASAQCSYQ